MKIIDAVWEKRNPGVNATTLNVEFGDDQDIIIDAINKVSTEYLTYVLKNAPIMEKKKLSWPERMTPSAVKQMLSAQS